MEAIAYLPARRRPPWVGQSLGANRIARVVGSGNEALRQWIVVDTVSTTVFSLGHPPSTG